MLQLGHVVQLDMDVHALVNDGLMTLFFLLAGLEIKRQLVTGELRDRRAAALPAIAALGGMVVPALIYTAFNAGHAGAGGWGIPVATDIAFAVGVVTLAGPRVPLGRPHLHPHPGRRRRRRRHRRHRGLLRRGRAAGLARAGRAGGRGDASCCAGAEVRSIVPYVVLGAVCWYGLRRCGVEAAIAGVVFGLLTPTRPFHDPQPLR